MKILGIDPGLASCGWAVLEFSNPKESKVVDSGVITTSNKSDIKERLKTIYTKLDEVIKKNKIEMVSIESQFYSKIAKNHINVYLSVGVILLLCAFNNIRVFEYPAKSVKSSIAGYGSADKVQIKKMLQLILKSNNQINSEHISDAVAVALCCLYSNNSFIL